MTQIISNTMPLGIPGDLSRSIYSCTIESYNMNAALPVSAYGLPVKAAAGATDTVTPIIAADTSASVVGILVRPNYSQGGNVVNQPFGTATPPLTGPVSVLKQGHIVVKCNVGTPAKEGLVYVRTVAGAGPIGGFEATADGANNFVLLGAEWMGAPDSEGNAELRYRVGNP